MFNDVMKKRRILVDGQVVDVPQKTTPGQIIQSVGKDPQITSLVTRGANGTSQYLPTQKPIQVRDGQELESALSGIGG
jgi:hypothetical protein